MRPPVYDESWPEEVQRVYHHDMEELWDKSITPHIFNMYHAQLEMYRSLLPQKSCRILDVGCAQASLGLLLAEAGHDVTVVDLRKGFLDYARSRWTHGRIRFLQGNIFEMQISETFDVVFANQILEHLVYPAEFITKLSSLLVPGGLLVMTTPNGAYLANSLPSYTELGDPSQWEHLQFTADGDGHFFAYTREELLHLFKDAGLQAVRCRGYETPWISGHIRFRYLHRVLPYRLLRSLDRLQQHLPLAGLFSHQLLVTGIRAAESHPCVAHKGHERTLKGKGARH